MSNIDHGVELWRSIAESMNKIITETGKKIDINNPVIWQDHLHRFSNQDWRDILTAYAAALDLAPELALDYRKRNLQTARALVLSAGDSDRPLDRKAKGGKRTAWAMIHSLRETWNELKNINLPNEDRKLPPTPKTLVETTEEFTRITVWHNLFEANEPNE